MNYHSGFTDYRLSWGKGFKLPSFFSLGHPLVGNPDFGPETSEAYDFRIKHEVSSLTSLSASVFHNRYFDLIDFGDSGVLVNREEVVISGVELGITSQLFESISVDAHYSVLSMDIKNSAEELNKRPKRIAGLTFELEAGPDVGISASVIHVGKMSDFSFPTGQQTLASYTRVDTSMRWRIKPEFEGVVAVDNILNEKYNEVIGLETEGALLRMAMHVAL